MGTSKRNDSRKAVGSNQYRTRHKSGGSTVEPVQLRLFAVSEFTVPAAPRRRPSGHRKARLRDVLKEVQGSKCGVCKRDLADNEITMDHIIPFSMGGRDRIVNLRILCAPCNVSRDDVFEYPALLDARCSTALLEEYARDGDSVARSAVVQHPACPEDTLRLMLSDRDARIRWAAADRLYGKPPRRRR